MEIWKSIDEKYKISNRGRVKSLARKIKYKLGGERDVKERILSVRKNTSGIDVVDLYLGGVKVTRSLDKLMREYWG